MTFAEFQAGAPARAIFMKLGLIEILEVADSWKLLRKLIVDYNGADEGRFVALVRNCDAVASSGERVMLHAICYAVDFAWLADELDTSDTWRRMDRAAGDWCRAVAACIEAWA